MSTIKNYTYNKLNINQELINEMLNEWNNVHKDSFYDISTSREKLSPALSKTRTYHLRSPVLNGVKITKTESTQNIIDCRDTVLYDYFPILKNLINKIGIDLYGGWKTMGRVFITKLDANEKIGRHIDEGYYFNNLHRFHIPLITQGARFHWDNEYVTLNKGELWQLNNSIPHWVENDGKERTHLIFDAS